VGIGTAVPDHKAHILTTDSTPLNVQHSNGTDVYIKLSNTADGAGNYLGADSNNLTFWTENTERMRISSTGVISGDGSGLTGVGGAWTLLSTTNITSNVSYIDVAFPTGYDRYCILFEKIYHNTSGHGISTVQSKLTNSNASTLLGTSSYVYHNSIGGGSDADANNMGTTSFRLSSYNNPYNSDAASMFYDIWYPLSSTIQTHGEHHSIGLVSDYDNRDKVASKGMFSMQVAQVNHTLRMQPDDNGINGSKGGFYKVWGMK